MSYNTGHYGNNRGYTELRGQQNEYGGQNTYANPNANPYANSGNYANQNTYGGYQEQRPAQNIEMNQFDSPNSPQRELEDLVERIDQAKVEMDNILKARSKQLQAVDGDAVQRAREIDASMARLMASNKALVDHIRLLKTKYQDDPTSLKIIERQGNRFRELTQDHARQEHAVQRDLKQQLRDQIEVAYGNSKTDAEKDAMVESGNVQIFQSAAMSSRRTEAQSALNNARDRQREIEKISEQMEVLLKLFENMNELVQEQEEVVTQIEQKTAAGAADIENGVTQLDTGIEKAKSARRKKWWCLLIVVILIIIIVIVIMVVVVKPIIENSNKKRSLEYLAHARRSILEGVPSKRSTSSQVGSALLE